MAYAPYVSSLALLARFQGRMPVVLDTTCGQIKSSLKSFAIAGAKDGARTHTLFLAADFESAASTNSATLAVRSPFYKRIPLLVQ